MKKLLIVLLFVLFVFLPTTVLADNTLLEVVAPQDVVLSANHFSVEVKLTGNPGITSIQFNLVYDSAKMKCIDIVNGTLLEGMMSASNYSEDGCAKIAAASGSAKKGDYIIATFVFEAIEDIESFSFSISDVALSNSNGEPVPCNVDGATLGAELIFDCNVDVNIDPTPFAPIDAPSEKPIHSSEQSQLPPQMSSNSDNLSGSNSEANEKSSVDESVNQVSSFTDTGGHWAESYIVKAVSRSLFKGYPDGSFHPNEAIARNQFMVVLYRAAGSPSVEGDVPFKDVSGQNDEFRQAIIWGYTNGFIGGRSNSVFDPNGYITRQELMKILFQYAGANSGVEMVMASVYDNQFMDSNKIADWAKNAMYWGIYHELISGSDMGLEPANYTTRAQVSKIITVFLENVMT